MHIIGTAHFVSRKAAIRYYRDQGFDAQDVERKLAEGEIFIGKPKSVWPYKVTELFVRDGRYHIQSGY